MRSLLSYESKFLYLLTHSGEFLVALTNVRLEHKGLDTLLPHFPSFLPKGRLRDSIPSTQYSISQFFHLTGPALGRTFLCAGQGMGTEDLVLAPRRESMEVKGAWGNSLE